MLYMTFQSFLQKEFITEDRTETNDILILKILDQMYVQNIFTTVLFTLFVFTI